MQKQYLSRLRPFTVGLLLACWFFPASANGQSLQNPSENRIALGLEAEERGFAPPYEIVVIGVRPGTPAEKAGIKAGDLITSAAGDTVGSIDQLAARVQKLSAGESLELGIQRGEAPLRVVAKFPVINQPPRKAELVPQGRILPTDPQSPVAPPMRLDDDAPGRPLPPNSSLTPNSSDSTPALQPLPVQPEGVPVVERPEPGSGRMGVTVENVETTPPGPGVPVKRGAVVVAVGPGSPAALVGVKPGNVIVAMDGVVIRDAAALIEEVSKTKPGQRVELGVYQGESLAKLAVVLTAPDDVTTGTNPSSSNVARPSLQPQPQDADSGSGLLGALGGFFGGNRAKPSADPSTSPAPNQAQNQAPLQPLPAQPTGPPIGFSPLQPSDPPMLNQAPANQGTPPAPASSPTSDAEMGEVKELKSEIQQLRLQLEALQKRLNELEGS